MYQQQMEQEGIMEEGDGEEYQEAQIEMQPGDLLKLLRYMINANSGTIPTQTNKASPRRSTSSCNLSAAWSIYTEQLWKKYDKNKDMLIGLQELKNIFFDLAQIELSDQEMMMLSFYMKEHIT